MQIQTPYRMRTETPRRCGQLSNTGDLLNLRGILRRLRTSWLIVGMEDSLENRIG